MTLTRVTQTMTVQRSYEAMQAGSGRLSRLQEQLTTGRVINRPSDDPTGTANAMRLRSTLAANAQYARNAEDGKSWLGRADTALDEAGTTLRRARELGLQGANTGAMSVASREALAIEVDQLRESLIDTANTTYLDRPIFGGITSGSVAFDDTGAYVGTDGAVNRTIGDGEVVKVNLDGEAVFGAAGSTAFDNLTALSTALRSGDTAALNAALTAVAGDLDRVVDMRAAAGATANRVDVAISSAADDEVSLTSSLSNIENTDLPRALIDLQLQETAYQAALGATARVVQPSLLDFLR